MAKIAALKKRLIRDPEFRKQYRQADADYGIIEALIRARLNANLSQTELAKRLGTTQSAVARFEGGHTSPSLTTLRRYADATGTKLEIALVSN